MEMVNRRIQRLIFHFSIFLGIPAEERFFVVKKFEFN